MLASVDLKNPSVLSYETMNTIPDAVSMPGFDPKALRTGILHLGCGNFHRGHQVAATQTAIEAEGKEGLRWGIASVTMRRRDLPDKLKRQDGLYTLLERGPEKTRASVMAAIAEPVFAPVDTIGIAARVADPNTRIVTLTVTANGYHLEPATGRLADTHPDIVHDLSATDRFITSTGSITAGLRKVRALGHTPPVIISCDNLSGNGQMLRQAVLDFASLSGDDALSPWIAGHVQFPDTMVDRIVPTMTPEDDEEARLRLGGLVDASPVVVEPWFQWIISNFDGPRPRWEAAGARFVNDVSPFEAAKLRMLNGTHMFLAYVGALAGCNTISEAACNPVIGKLARRFMVREQASDLSFGDAETETYADQLITRFRNPSIVHEMGRVGRNGSVKMATRVLEPMRDNLAHGRDVSGATLLIASWIRWFSLHEQDELDVTLHDPREDEFVAICREARGDFRRQTEAFLNMEEVFGQPLQDHEQRITEITAMLERLANEGETVAHELAAML